MHSKSNAYTENWFESQRVSALTSARKVVPAALALAPAKSVVDIGCGVGAWLRAFIENGIPDAGIRGVDGAYVQPESLMIPPERFRSADLSKPLQLDERFDLVISLEVAEHLPAAAAEAFVDSLTSLGPVVLFSAAVPGAGGTGHVNERWPAYWAKLFRARNFVPCDALRKRIWYFKDVEHFYQQNAFFYVQRDRLADYPALQRDALADDEQPVAMIHPKLFLLYKNLARTSLERITKSALRRVGLSPMAVTPPDFDGDV